MRVLIADDDAGTRLLISAALMRLGHECVEAASGDEALQLFTQPPLPTSSSPTWDARRDRRLGADLARRAPCPTSTTPTSWSSPATPTRPPGRHAMEAGADDLVIKPLDPADLERKLIAAARVTALHRRLHRDARQDPLTGIGNRLRLAEDVEALCGRVARYGHVYCAALLDVDHFKALQRQRRPPAGRRGAARGRRRARARRSAAATRCTATAARSSSCCCPSRRSTAPRWRASGCARRSRSSRSPAPTAAS